MRPTRLAALASCLVVLATTATAAVAAPRQAAACNLRGSWVAGTAEASRYVAALTPGVSSVRLTGGALSATFDRGTFSFGGLGLTLAGQKGRTTLKEEIDIDSSAPYRVRGARIALGPGSFRLHYVQTTLVLGSGVSAPVRLPDQSARTPAHAVAYRCTPGVLHLTVRTPAGDSVTLALRRDR